MNAAEIRQEMRSRLKRIGVMPTPRGEAEAMIMQPKMRRFVHEAIDKLDPADLFAVWAVILTLTQTDEPPAAGTTKVR